MRAETTGDELIRTDLKVAEGRVNFDCRWGRTSMLRVGMMRVGIAAGLLLVAAGCMILAGSRSRLITESASARTVDGFSAANGLGAPAITLASTAAVPAGAASAAHSAAGSRAHSMFAGLPLMFEPNQGQGNLDASDPRVKFVARGSGYSLLLGSQGAVLNLSHSDSSNRDAVKRGQSAVEVESLQMKLAGANRNAAVTGAELLPGKSNYLIGNDETKWRTNIPQFARVRYENIYPGINLVFYGNQGRLEYDFQVAPGSDPGKAELEFDGAKQLALEDGALVVKGKSGSVRFEAPRVYQEIAGRQQTVAGSFALRGSNRAGFVIGTYDHSRELVIDPLLTFSTYFGGADNELNNSIAVDSGFNIYLAGSTNSPSLPGPGVTTATGLVGLQNVYLAKIQPPQGSNPPLLLYVTYLGGTGMDTPVGVAVDGEGNPYVAGTTSSTDFPFTLTNAYQTGIQPGSTGTTHIFVTRMNNTFSGLYYSSYLSGSGTDAASGMTIDGQGYIYVTGTTTSTNPQDYTLGSQPAGDQWPVISLPNGLPFQSTPKAPAGVVQFFVTKVNTANASSASIAYSTYFGGGQSGTTPPLATGGGIAVDRNGNIYFTGTTNFLYLGTTGTSSTDFPILNAYQPCLDTPAPTVIVNPPSCSYTSGNPTDTDAFVAKLNPNAPAGTGQLSWSTYVGGSVIDSGTGIAVDTGAANVYITGTTNSPDIGESAVTDTTSAAYQRCLNTPTNPPSGTACTTTTAATDAFVARLTNPATTCTTSSCNLTLTYFSYLGGSANEAGLAVTVDQSSGALLTGWTQSNAPPPNGFLVFGGADIQNTFGGTQDAFIARINTAATTLSTAGSWTTLFGLSGATEGTSIALDGNQTPYVAGDTSGTVETINPLSSDVNNAGGSDAFVAQLQTACSLSISGLLTLGNNQTFVSAGNQATFNYTVTNAGPDPCNNFVVIDNVSSQYTNGVAVAVYSASATSGICSGASSTSTLASCTINALPAGQTATVTFVLIPQANTQHAEEGFTGGAVQVLSSNNIFITETSVPATMSDYLLNPVSPTNASVTAGNTASFEVRLTPSGTYSNSISLSCSGAPAGAACNFTGSPVTLVGSSPGTSMLNLTTTARPIVTTMASPFSRQFYALWIFVPGLALLGLGSRDRRRRRIAGMLLLCAVLSLLVVLPACSHTTIQPPVSGTPAGQYTINVTATSGTDTQTVSIVLNVS
jgi:uncharacterized repeat protein (TIGR01451 family)